MTSTIESSSTVQRRTRVRFVVVGMAVLLGMVSYLDRACLGTLARPIMGDLHLADYELGYAQIAFALAYGMFGIISAWWGARPHPGWPPVRHGQGARGRLGLFRDGS